MKYTLFYVLVLLCIIELNAERHHQSGSPIKQSDKSKNQQHLNIKKRQNLRHMKKKTQKIMIKIKIKTKENMILLQKKQKNKNKKILLNGYYPKEEVVMPLVLQAKD